MLWSATKKARRCRRSKGNIIDPLVLIDKYGCDALRFTLAALAAQGRDIKLAESRVEGYRNFATKLWNAARFCQMNECQPVAGLRSGRRRRNRSIGGSPAKLAERPAASARPSRRYRFNDAANAAYQFVWNSFCDWYLEFAKPILPRRAMRRESRNARHRGVGARPDPACCCIPFMPFITEELVDQLGEDDGHHLMTAPWPGLTSTMPTPRRKWTGWSSSSPASERFGPR